MSLPTNFFIGRGGGAVGFLDYLPTTFSAMTTWTNGQEGNFGNQLANTSPIGCCISRTGTKVFVTGYNSGKVHDITLSTPWDLSSYTSFVSRTSIGSYTFPTGSQLSGCFWSENGEYFMLTNRNDPTNTNQPYSVSTFKASSPYDLSTAVHVSTNTNISNYMSNGANSPNGASFSRDGLYWAFSTQGMDSSYVYRMIATTPFIPNSNGTSSSPTSRLLTPTGSGLNALGMTFDHSGKVVYYSGFNGSNEIYYQICATPWSIPSMNQGHSVITLPSTLARSGNASTNFSLKNVGCVLPNEGKALIADYSNGAVYLYDVA